MGLAVGILVFGYALRQVEAVAGQLGKLRIYLNGAEGYLTVLLKVIGITYICEFSADVCKKSYLYQLLHNAPPIYNANRVCIV